MEKLVLAFCLLLGMPLAHADIVGRWQTIDDETGEAKSIVEIQQRDGQYVGTVRDLLAEPDDSLCEECKGRRKDQPIVGMEIISDMEKRGDEYTGGEILDPATGKVYRCKLWLEDENTLKVRGYLGFLYRTQTWKRVD